MTKNKIGILLCCLHAAAPVSAQSPRTMSFDAMVMLNTAGFLSGAADACKVVPSLANALNSGISLAIAGGKYGNQAAAHVMLNNARQEGISAVVSGKADCSKVEQKIRDVVRALQ